MARPYQRRGNIAQNICRFYQQGHCAYGDGCKFSHTRSESGSRPIQRSEQPCSADAQLEYARWKRTVQKAPIRQDPAAIKELWTSALGVLDTSDKNHRQKIPKDLVDEDHTHGHDHLMQVLMLTPASASPLELDDVVDPFFRVIAHPELLHCISVDSYVGDVYSFISGSGGSRAIPFFERVVTSLVAEQSLVGDSTAKAGLLIPVATSLQELLKRNPRALYNEQLPVLVEILANTCDVLGLAKQSTEYAAVKKSVAEIKRLLNRSSGLLRGTEPEAQKAKAHPTSTYPRQIQLPGTHRHDNDHVDITSIQLLPTEDEIRCDQAEYLPGIAFEEPCLVEGVERLLDRHFRLYRHDNFGEMKLYLNNLIKICEQSPESASRVGVSTDGIRAFTYRGVQVMNAWFEQKSGLEFTLSFPQPDSVREKSAKLRQRWWQDTKRLEEGALVCLLMLTGGQYRTNFLIVTKKNIGLEDHHGLAAGARALTQVKVLSSRGETGNEDQVRHLLTSSIRGKDAGNHVLVEFPTILPSTFLPILENLQEMQRTSRLPFHEWLAPAPDASQDMTPVLVPPPLYARSSSFAFDLSPILRKSATPLTFSPATSDVTNTVSELQERSCLDLGQCEALLSAMGSELALIQGPPGTGKSYLGVQLMRCLIQVKDRAKLGPILVV